MSAGVLAVIPARGGSKGMPRKNLRRLGGLPLVAHSIRAAGESRLIDTFVVSTEDEEIAAVASAHGADVLRRPAELATDAAQNNAVMRHAIAERAAGHRFVVLLQPTSPLRRGAHIDACLAPLLAGNARSVMTVTPVDHHPGKAVRLQDGLVVPYTNAVEMEARRQDMPEAFRQNGAVYALAIADFLAEDRLYLPPCRASIMPPEDSVDIDRELDLQLAELLLQARGGIPGGTANA